MDAISDSQKTIEDPSLYKNMGSPGGASEERSSDYETQERNPCPAEEVTSLQMGPLADPKSFIGAMERMTNVLVNLVSEQRKIQQKLEEIRASIEKQGSADTDPNEKSRKVSRNARGGVSPTSSSSSSLNEERNRKRKRRSSAELGTQVQHPDENRTKHMQKDL